MKRRMFIPSYYLNISSSRHWKGICIHHSATTDGRLFDWGAIWNYHTNVKGWTTIGYNFGIEMLNGNYVFNCGRPLTMTGAHCKGMNGILIGFLFTGNFDLHPPSEEILRFSVPFLRTIMDTFEMKIDDIHCHNEYADKTCPGRYFPIGNLQQMIMESYIGTKWIKGDMPNVTDETT